MVMTEIVKKFFEIRDIEYRIPLTVAEFNQQLDYRLSANCSVKMILFKRWLDEAGFLSKYRVCEFRWSDLGLPENLIFKPHPDPDLHVYLEIYLNGSWIDVDPTWDKSLQDFLPVNNWDGNSDCSIAVPIIKKYGYEESNKIMNTSFDDDEMRGSVGFYEAFNAWLDQIKLNVSMESS